MSLYSNLRRRRRRRLLVLARRFLVLGVLAAGFAFVWDLGRQSESGRALTVTRQLEEQAARLATLAEQQAKALADNELLQREIYSLRVQLRREGQLGDLSGVMEEARRKVAEGVAISRLEARIRSTAPLLTCGEAVERSILVRTGTSRHGDETATFANGAIAISLTAQDANGVLPERYHPAHSLRLVAAQAGQVPYVVEGRLPHSFALTREEAEYRFLVFAPLGSRSSGTAIVRGERCLEEKQ